MEIGASRHPEKGLLSVTGKMEIATDSLISKKNTEGLHAKARRRIGGNNLKKMTPLLINGVITFAFG
jgi:hypothetical protein